MQLAGITESKVDQAGPPPQGEFVYVDISSVDNKAKRIVEPKRLLADNVPSRARQRLRAGGRRRAPEHASCVTERRYLRVANVKDDFIDYADLEAMRFSSEHAARYELLPGDVLVSEGQSPERLG